MNIKNLCIAILFCVLTANLFYSNALAKEDISVSVRDKDFSVENFFTLEKIRFDKKKVNFNKGWLGIFMENEKEKGILVVETTKGSPAEKAGLKTGDIITKINDEPLIDNEGKNLIRFKKIIETMGAGAVPVLTVVRENNEIECKPKLIAKLLKNAKSPVKPPILTRNFNASTPLSTTPHSMTSFRAPAYRTGRESRNQNSQRLNLTKETNITQGAKKEPGQSFVHFAMENEEYKKMCSDTIQRMGEEVYAREGYQSNEESNPFRLSIIDYLLQNPVDTYETGKIIHGFFVQENVTDQIRSAAELLDVEFSANEEEVKPDSDLPSHIQGFIDDIVPCVSFVKDAFSALTTEEFDFLYQSAQKIWVPNETIESSDVAKVLELSRKVDLSKLFKAVVLLLNRVESLKNHRDDQSEMCLQPFTLPTFLKNTDTAGISSDKEPGEGAGYSGDVLLVEDTSVGKIVIGGTGTTYYYDDAAIIVDLGGNDYYFNNAGASGKEMPVSVCIDFYGNDTYDAKNPFAQGTGRFGVGILKDFEGDDTYSGQDFAQGSSLYGIGMLIDKEGDDFYSGNALNIGVGFFGLGLLADANGNDAYFSRQFSQGVGFTKGIGVLEDYNGSDFYFAGGKYPDFRDPEKSFQSMSQGMGMGIRPETTIVGASGGIGLLIDKKGSDKYHGDYFSQGSGYYFSMGLLFDTEGSDAYYAGRYAQGAGIHSAIGIQRDNEGDDKYECSFGVSQGCGHDTSIGFLVDNSGNDSYSTGVVSQGAGMERGFGVLADFQGNDIYHAKDSSQGFSFPSKTEEIIGIGMLLDNQGDSDVFRDIIEKDTLFYRENGGLILNKK
ncbi:MAG: PDZ domain-containing protein [Candidatus Kuenenia sp.]|nr:PDZ domain-containing protein [Candidatus Kuenenia hertensis]